MLKGEKMNKRLYKAMTFVEECIASGMIIVGVAMIGLNLTPNMPLYGLILLAFGLYDVIDE